MPSNGRSIPGTTGRVLWWLKRIGRSSLSSSYQNERNIIKKSTKVEMM